MQAAPAVVLGLGWLALVATGLAARPLLPPDETRYVAVAWEMWLRGDFLVPHLNGLPYSHKPPLLFWLVDAGWGLFGVNDWWPRTIPALASLATALLTVALGLRLWPASPRRAWLAGTVLLGGLLWSLFTTALMFDLLLALWAVVGVWGILVAAAGARRRGFALLTAALALGVLTKGPVIYLHLLPLALTAPWWRRERGGPGLPRPGAWYGGLILAALLAAALALAWALPAARAGGPAYAEAILWGQTAHRVTESFAHQRPWFWYLPMLPVILFPWLLWPPFWRWRSHAVDGDWRARMLLAWLLPVFLAFCLVSGKQLHYLLPLFPGLALLLARAADRSPPAGGPAQSLPALVWALAGVLLLAAPGMAGHGAWPAWLAFLPPWAGGAMLALAGAALWPWRSEPAARRLPRLAAVAMAAVAVLQAGLFPALLRQYDVRPLARYLGAVQARGIPLAHLGKYHGQFHFYGRLERPLEVVSRPALAPWAAAHPDGQVVLYTRRDPVGRGLHPLASQPYRSGRFVVLAASELAGRPGLVQGL